MSPAVRDVPSVAGYLRPEEEIVPFRTRPELERLLTWCTSGRQAAARLVTGDGGSGKTRLALRLGADLVKSGWGQLWVTRESERGAAIKRHKIDRPCLLVVDYAETRSDLAALLDDVAADEDGPKVRVILLARSVGEWWPQMQADAKEQTTVMLEADLPLSLGPVPAAGGPQEVFNHALTAFSGKLGVARPDASLTLPDPDPVILVIHAAALLAVVDHDNGARPLQATSDSAVMAALVRHETRYWNSKGLGVGPKVLSLAVAVGCLIGAENQTAATELLSRIPELDSGERRGQVAQWLHHLYPMPPHDDAQKKEWLGPLRPDRLAEQLVADQLVERSELISPLFAGLGEARATRALTVLARAVQNDDRVAGLLRDALASDLDHLAVPALSVAVETNPVTGELLSQAISGGPVSRETLTRVAEAAPYPSFALAAPAAKVLQRLAEDSADDSERAKWLMALSGRLDELGQREQALKAIEEAIGIYRPLADDLRRKLASSLNSRSRGLGDLGQREQALAVIKEAVDICRPLAAEHPDALLPELADVLHTQSHRLAELGQREEALTVIEEAVRIYRPLAAARPSDLAISLSSQSMWLAELGRREEALTVIEEAVGICRPLAAEHPDAFGPKLADVLHTQSYRLAELGQNDQALAVIKEAVRIYRPLAAARPGVFGHGLAISLSSQSMWLAKLGRRREALTVIEEAVGICRTLAAARPGAFGPKLADVLHTQSHRLAELGQNDQALAVIEEAVRIYRTLAAEHPGAFGHCLAISLNSQSMWLAELGRCEEALTVIEEAVGICRPLAAEHPDAFGPKLADVLHTQSHRLAELGQNDQALTVIKEAVRIYRPLAAEHPGAFGPKLADVLHTQSYLGLHR